MQRKTQSLDTGFSAEVDAIDEQSWSGLVRRFDDLSIYQTWPYGDINAHGNISRLVVKRDGQAVAAAQVRIMKVPGMPIGIAYVRWGPLWKLKGGEPDAAVLRQALRALRNEYVCNRGLVLRVFPILSENAPQAVSGTLEKEGFTAIEHVVPGRTIIMDLAGDLEHLRGGMGSMWKRNLKTAEKHALDIEHGSSDEMFAAFVEIYKETVLRKKFAEPNNIFEFREMQARLGDADKMIIMLGKSADGVCSGLIVSALGDTAIYLFGATSNIGMKACGSYLLQWRLIEELKRRGIRYYNLNGINAVRNPGTYKFKRDLAGENGVEQNYLGRFDSQPGFIGAQCVQYAEKLRNLYGVAKARVRIAPSSTTN